MAEDQDRAYRMLFSFPRMIEDLVRLCLEGDWIERLDFTTLEKVSERDLDERLVRREKDLLWRLKFRPDSQPAGGDTWCYIYLQLEFQSKTYRFMALRTLIYKALLYEDLIRRKALNRARRLPPVLSIVLYNGERPWSAPTRLDELIETAPDLPDGADLLGFHLIEARNLPPERLRSVSSPVAELFRLEQAAHPPEIGPVTQNLLRQLAGPDNLELRQAFTVFLDRVILQRLALSDPEQPHTNDLQEVSTMIAQKVERWTREWWQQGWQEGRAEGEAKGRAKGKAEGLREGEALALLRLLERKFGAVPARFLKRVQRADLETLQLWLDRTLTAETLEEVFSSTASGPPGRRDVPAGRSRRAGPR